MSVLATVLANILLTFEIEQLRFRYVYKAYKNPTIFLKWGFKKQIPGNQEGFILDLIS